MGDLRTGKLVAEQEEHEQTTAERKEQRFVQREQWRVILRQCGCKYAYVLFYNREFAHNLILTPAGSEPLFE